MWLLSRCAMMTENMTSGFGNEMASVHGMIDTNLNLEPNIENHIVCKNTLGCNCRLHISDASIIP